MNTSPLVSVIMTSYNREKYIGEAIRSVCASSYSNFELIVVDDFSKDRTVDIARRHAAEDPRIRVFVNASNLQDYPNRNLAASYARGKYIKYVDADDYLYPWGLQLLVEMMEQFPEAGWGLCSMPQYRDRPYPLLLSPGEAYRHHYFGPGLFHKAPLSAIIKTEVFKAAGGFKPVRLTGDFELWHRLACDHSVLLMPDGIVWYREHAEQESVKQERFSHEYEIIRKQYLGSAACPMESSERRKAIRIRKKILTVDVISLLGRRKFVEMMQKVNCLLVYLR